MSEHMSEQCVFCEIVAGRAPALVVAENDLAIAILDIQPLAEGHCLVIPRRHVTWWDEMNARETEAVFALARQTANKIRKAYAPDCVTMYARGRRIPHTHIFLVPTYAGDPVDRYFNALEGFQEQSATLATLQDATAMRDACDKLRGS